MLFARIVPDRTLNLVEATFFSAVANMAPAFVFTLLNESDVSLRWAIASLDIFFWACGVLACRKLQPQWRRHADTPTESNIEQVAVVDDESRPNRLHSLQASNGSKARQYKIQQYVKRTLLFPVTE
jgi:hypothetical protein